ncbi:hypothetical protein UH38_02195 [Aliterella atlantica CENA595]|uniref:GTP-binding protein n=2 Tax=Aliterella TaxID=1827277 RepID=A0A0D8ZZ90_9CYAN|nr:hypothetical protein UH38_02195 [Aliterella atlantica CENA595]
MMVILRRPILAGGIGLTLALWLWQSFDRSLGQISELGIFSAIALGVCIWLFQQSKAKKAQLIDNSPPNREKVEKAIYSAQNVVNQLQIEADKHELLPQIQAKVTQLNEQLERQNINVAIAGGKGVGKTTLIQVLSANWENTSKHTVSLVETAALFNQIVKDEAEIDPWQQAIAADLVLFVTDSDLKYSEWQVLQKLAEVEQRALLIFNKQDRYLPEERAIVLHSLQQTAKDVVAIAACPNPVKVRQHQVDGTVSERLDTPAPEIANLTSGLQQILANEGQQLIWATTIRNAGIIKAEAKTVINAVRRDRATPIIEQYQWIAAAAAFANPVPALDLLATAAINAQLVVELGNIYQQKFSLQQAQTVAGNMGSLMLKLGLVELSTKAIATVLKSNVVTYVAGGALQGVSAAYLTRVAALSLVEYFQSQEVTINTESGLNLDKLGQTLQKVFQQNQQVAFLQTFVQQGVSRILPTSGGEAEVSAS